MARDGIEKTGHMLGDLGVDGASEECFKESSRRFGNVAAGMAVGQPARGQKRIPQAPCHMVRDVAAVQQILNERFADVPGVQTTIASMTESTRGSESREYCEQAERMVMAHPEDTESTHLACRLFQVAHVLDPDNGRTANPAINFLIKSCLASRLIQLLGKDDGGDLQQETELACEMASGSELWAVAWPLLEAKEAFAAALRLLDAMRDFLAPDEYAEQAQQIAMLKAVSDGFGQLAHAYRNGQIDADRIADEEPRLWRVLENLRGMGYDADDIDRREALLGAMDLVVFVNRKDWDGAARLVERIIVTERLDAEPNQFFRDLHSRYCSLGFFAGLCALLGAAINEENVKPVAGWLGRMREFNPTNWQVGLDELLAALPKQSSE